MLNLQSSYASAALIANLFAYFITVSLTGYFKAWAALKAGDDTAERMGMLTLNPMVHMSMIGMIFLPLFGWGFGQHIWINPYSISSRVRVYAAYCARPFAHLMLALITLMSFVAVFGKSALYFFAVSGRSVADVLPIFLRAYSGSHSLIISVGLILLALIAINVILAEVYFVLSMIDIAFYHAGYGVIFDWNTVFFRTIVAVSALFLFGPLVWFYVKYFLLYFGTTFATIVGV